MAKPSKYLKARSLPAADRDRPPSEVEQLIAALQPQPATSFTWGSIINLGAIPLITAAVFFIGQWFVNKDTTARNETEIKAEKIEREKMRENFFTSQNQLIQVLNKLEARMSVSEKQQELTNRQLDKLGDLINGRRRSKADD